MPNAPEKADFRIDFEGRWFHDGAPIQRTALVKLFADKGLKIDENGNYWLASPFEKYPVDIEDVPFLIVDYAVSPSGLDFITNMEERIPVGPEHPVELRYVERAGFELPYIHVRGGLYARVNRSVYYNLIEEFGSFLVSRGEKFPLG